MMPPRKSSSGDGTGVDKLGVSVGMSETESQPGEMSEVEYRAHYILEGTHWWFRFRREVVFDILRRSVPAGKDALVLEIGCGTGGNMLQFQEHYKVAGVEISEIAASLAREKTGCEVYLGDFRTVNQIHWPDVRAVLLLDVLEHVRKDRSMLEDILELLPSEAYLLMTVPSSPWLWSRHDVALGHLRRYTSRDVRHILHDLPAEVVLKRRLYWTVSLAVALYRLTLGRLRSSGQSDLKDVSALVNRALLRMVSMEKVFIRSCPVPWGLSHLVVLRRK